MSRSRTALTALVLAAVACGSPASTAAKVAASASIVTNATNTPSVGASRSNTAPAGPTFRQVLAASNVSEYKVMYKVTDTNGRDSFSGEQQWFVKSPQARFDFSSDVAGQRTIVSLYALVDGTVVCYSDVARLQCFGMSTLSTALQQNPAASVHEALVQNPERFDGVLVETRQIAGEQAYCYNVRALTAQTSGLTEGRFCYSTLGIPLLSRFKTQGGEVSMEATRLYASVSDSDFTLPATPTTLGRP